jgi:hypothetical protein
MIERSFGRFVDRRRKRAMESRERGRKYSFPTKREKE